MKRVLLFNRFKVKHVMNITDVGHLSGENLGDADQGEDKVEKAARLAGKTPKEITDFYTDAFKKDLRDLNILFPDILCRATEHIDDMIEMIKKIEMNGYTYNSGGNVYFDTSKFKSYSELANLNLKELKHGARVEIDKNKRNPSDFVLWFTVSEKFKDHLQQWDSPWGRGWPGWHIECSAMSSKYLGEQFDIHSGGEDHINVHHTNEIAQSEAAFGKRPWVRFWVHGAFLVLEKEKMSKSLGNFITLSTLAEKGYFPMHYRYFCFTAHYRKPLVFSIEAMEGAKQSFEILKAKVLQVKESAKEKKEGRVNQDNQFYLNFLEAVNDDLNIPRALAVVYEMLKDNNTAPEEKLGLLYKFDEVLGFNFKEFRDEELVIDGELSELLNIRERARKEKNFKKADDIRDILKEKGYIIEDTASGPRLKRI